MTCLGGLEIITVLAFAQLSRQCFASSHLPVMGLVILVKLSPVSQKNRKPVLHWQRNMQHLHYVYMT